MCSYGLLSMQLVENGYFVLLVRVSQKQLLPLHSPAGTNKIPSVRDMLLKKMIHHSVIDMNLSCTMCFNFGDCYKGYIKWNGPCNKINSIHKSLSPWSKVALTMSGLGVVEWLRPLVKTSAWDYVVVWKYGEDPTR